MNMNAFDSARMVESEAMLRLRPFFKAQSDEGMFILTDKGRLAPMLQKTVGDLIMKRNGRVYGVELKAEKKCRPNIFLESWSNRNLQNPDNHAQYGSKVGWIYTTRADLLFYYFIDADLLWIFSMFGLKQWAFTGSDGGAGKFHTLRQVEQKAYQQKNETLGRLAPIEQLERELTPKPKCFHVGEYLSQLEEEYMPF